MLRRRKAPEINAGSMADIAFLLLTFFLMTTTIGVDKGIARLLPPAVSPAAGPMEVKRRNLLQININASNRLDIDGVEATQDELVERVREFVTGAAFSEKEMTVIEPLGECEVSKGIVLLRCDPEASYETFIAVQNELTRAFEAMRNSLAVARFGRRFTELDLARRTAVQRAVPMRIAEK